MPVFYRRPGVYLEESLLINPVDVAGTTTVAAFVGAALKGPPNVPLLVSSWSDYVTIFGGFDLIEPPVPPNPNDLTYEVFGSADPPANLTDLKSHQTYGDGQYQGEPFGEGQYVLLGDASKAHYNEGTVNVTNKELTANVVTLTVATDPTQLVEVGKPINVALTPADPVFDGTYTVTAADATTISYAKTNTDVTSEATTGTAGVELWKSGPAAGNAAPPPTKPPMALSYLPFTVYSFFQSGGRFAWVVRAISSDAESAGDEAWVEVNGQDSGASPLTAFTINAISVGVWGNGLSYNLITQSSTPAGSPPIQDIFAIQVLLKNAFGEDEVVETFANLSISGRVAGSRKVDAVVNDPASGSRYIRITGVNPNQLRPVSTEAAVPLTSGIDPGLPNSATLGEAAAILEKVEGPINLNVCSYLTDANLLDTPSAPANTVSAAVDPRTLFPGREDVVAFNDSAPPKTSEQSSGTYASTLKTGPWMAVNNSYAANYAPWIIIPHPNQVGATIAIPPGGAVIGVTARIDATIGVHRAPAGIIAGIANAVGVQCVFTDTELGDLNSVNINIIRPVIGAGICVMGARTRKGYGPDRYVSARRVLINLKEQLRRSTQYAIFENNDERLWSSLRITGDNICRPMWEQGGLRGVTQQQAYYVKCDSDLNTPAVIASGEVRMEVGVALQYPAEFVVIKITQITGTQFSAGVQIAS